MKYLHRQVIDEVARTMYVVCPLFLFDQAQVCVHHTMG